MILDNIERLKTDEKLLNELRSVSTKRLTADEIMEQKVSFVYGSITPREGVTKDNIRKYILESEGTRTVATSASVIP